MPERLRKSIQDQQERSEVLISVIQLVIVSIFGFYFTYICQRYPDISRDALHVLITLFAF